MSMQQTINSIEYLAVPKYSRIEAAMRYVAFCLPDRKRPGSTNNFSPYARQAEYSTIASITRDDLIAFHKKYTYPNNIILNDAWWADNYDTLQKRYTEWMLL
jgi:putative spermidine/putrescine transport system substrate-binding protein